MLGLPFLIRRVEGRSMEPLFRGGDILFLVRSKRFSIGDIVCFKIDDQDYIKRISDIADNQAYVVGDNRADSLDSRRFGWIDLKQINYKFVFKF